MNGFDDGLDESAVSQSDADADDDDDTFYVFGIVDLLDDEVDDELGPQKIYLSGNLGADTWYVASVPDDNSPLTTDDNNGDLDVILGYLNICSGTMNWDAEPVCAGETGATSSIPLHNDPVAGYDLDVLYVNDRGDPNQRNYLINPNVTGYVPNSIVNDSRPISPTDSYPIPDPDRDFAGVFYDANMDYVRMDGTDEVNEFTLRPSETTQYYIDGNLPQSGVCYLDGGDYLRLDLSGLSIGRQIGIDSVGTGWWDLTGGYEDVDFENIERFNHVDIIAVAAGAKSTGNHIVQAYDAETHEFKFQVKPYESTHRGGVRTAVGDLNCDGLPDLVTSPAANRTSTVRIYNGSPTTQIVSGRFKYPAELLRSFDAYSANFKGGASPAIGDVNRDGANDLVVAPGPGWLPEVHVYNVTTNNPAQTLPGLRTVTEALMVNGKFNAFAGTFKQGVNVAVGDIDGDGYAEIVAGVAKTAPALVNVHELDAALGRFALRRSFEAFPRSFIGGVFVSVGDFDRDGVRDIITSGGSGWIPQINVFKGAAKVGGQFVNNQMIDLPATASFIFKPRPSTYRGGIPIAAKPADGGDPGSVEAANIFAGFGPNLTAPRNIKKIGLNATMVDAIFTSVDFSGGAYLG